MAYGDRQRNPPRYAVGDKINNYTVIDFLGWRDNPSGKNGYRYTVECRCGKTYNRYQHALISHVNERRQRCVSCARRNQPKEQVIHDDIPAHIIRLAVSGR